MSLHLNLHPLLRYSLPPVRALVLSCRVRVAVVCLASCLSLVSLPEEPRVISNQRIDDSTHSVVPRDSTTHFLDSGNIGSGLHSPTALIWTSWHSIWWNHSHCGVPRRLPTIPVHHVKPSTRLLRYHLATRIYFGYSILCVPVRNYLILGKKAARTESHN